MTNRWVRGSTNLTSTKGPTDLTSTKGPTDLASTKGPADLTRLTNPRKAGGGGHPEEGAHQILVEGVPRLHSKDDLLLIVEGVQEDLTAVDAEGDKTDQTVNKKY